MVFGKVAVNQAILNPDFVEKFITIKSGEFYTIEQLVRTHNNLSQSIYFDLVNVRPDTENDGYQVPVTITLRPKKRHHFSFGVGFDTDIGPLIDAGYTNRRLNRLGHFLTSELSLIAGIVDCRRGITCP